MAAVGDAPDRLGPARVVPGAAEADGVETATARDGTIVACFGGRPPGAQPAIDCRTAPPGHGFGAPQVVARRNAGLNDVTVRSDGSVIVAFSRDAARRRRRLLWRSAPLRRPFGPVHTLATADQGAGVSLGSAPDGTVVAAWSKATTQEFEPRTPVLRMLAPGAPDFGAPVRFSRDRSLSGGVSVDADESGLVLRYYTRPAPEEIDAPWAVLRRPDGSFAAAVPIPTPAAEGFAFRAGSVVFDADGTPTAVGETWREADTDCGDVDFGRIAAGPLDGSAPPATLSHEGQIAIDPSGARLADGSLLAVWEDAADGNGHTRLEYAVRPAGGSFGDGRALPLLAARDYAIASAGGRALVAWVTGELPDGPSRLVVSASRTAPPYAPVAPRPAHPQAPCG